MDSASANMLNMKIEKIEQEIKLKLNQILYKDMTYVLIIGITGCGKSSLTCCLSDKGVRICKGKGNQVILEGEGIVSGCQSGTKEPSIVIDYSSKIIFFDCPGFDDTEGFNQEIVNSFIIDYLLNIIPNKKLKILLAISASQFESYRGQGALKSIDMILKMFPNPNELQKLIGLVITKGEVELNGNDYIDQLELDSNCDKNKSDVQKWFNFFKINHDHVFAFPKASRSKIGQNYNFDDHDKLINFIQASQIYNIPHNIALSENGTIYVINMKYDLIQSINDICRSIFNIINNDIRNANCSYEFNEWINRINQLYYLFIYNTKDLIDFFNQKIPKSYIYLSYFEKLKNLDVLNYFISKVINDYNGSSILMKSIKSLALETLSELKYKYDQSKIQEENERKRIEYEILMKKKEKEEEIRRKKEEEIKKQLEIQRLKEEKQKRKIQILNSISHFQKLVIDLNNDMLYTPANKMKKKIADLENELAQL